MFSPSVPRRILAAATAAALSGGALTLLTQPATAADPAATAVAPTAAGPAADMLVFTRDANNDGAYGLYRAAITASDPKAIIAESASISVRSAKLSPAGTQVAALVTTTSTKRATLEVMNLDGSGRHSVVSDGKTSAGTTELNDYGFSWSPDSTRLVYGVRTIPSSGAASLGLRTVNANGAPASTPVNGSTDLIDPAYSHDKSVEKIAAVSVSPNNGSVVVLTPSTGNVERLTTLSFGEFSGPAWSPTGDELAFSAWDKAHTTADLVVLSADGRPRGAVADYGVVHENASWAPDGSRIWFDRYRYSSRTPSDLYTVAPTGTSLKQVTATTTVDESAPSLAAADTTAPGTPTLAAPTTLAGASITLGWTDPRDVDWSRTIVTRQEGTGPPVDVYEDRGGRSRLTDTGVKLGHTYTYSVIAVDGAGNRSAPLTRMATALARPVMKAASPTSGSSTNASFPVSWATGNPAGTLYNVRYTYRDGSTWSLRPGAIWKPRTTATSAIFGSGSTSPVTPRLGYTYYLQAEALDGFGNSTGYSPLAAAAVPLDQTSVSYASGWRSTAASGRWRGTLKTTKTKGANATLAAYTRAFQIVGDRCATCGSVRIYVDGTYKATVSTYASSTKPRQVLWSSGNLGAIAKHKLTIVPVLSRGKQVRLDAIATVR